MANLVAKLYSYSVVWRYVRSISGWSVFVIYLLLEIRRVVVYLFLKKPANVNFLLVYLRARKWLDKSLFKIQGTSEISRTYDSQKYLKHYSVTLVVGNILLLCRGIYGWHIWEVFLAQPVYVLLYLWFDLCRRINNRCYW